MNRKDFIKAALVGAGLIVKSKAMGDIIKND